jgi:hypothetical protein
MGFWGFYRLDEDTPAPEHVITRRVRHELDPKLETIGGRVIPALLEEG